MGRENRSPSSFSRLGFTPLSMKPPLRLAGLRLDVGPQEHRSALVSVHITDNLLEPRIKGNKTVPVFELTS
jgi:hypothetical protein